MPEPTLSPEEPVVLHEHLTPLRPLLGLWRTTGTVHGPRGARSARLGGHDSWTALPGGRWIAHQSATTTSGVPNYLHEVVGGSHPDGGWQMLVFDEGLLPELTRVSLDGPHHVVVEGEGTRGVFDLRLAAEGVMTAHWEREVDGARVRWLDLHFHRRGTATPSSDGLSRGSA
ncbi:hypothetical protein [Nocardioides aequoreus]|uniref:hypothetical protein n=1 Tax=Nocardioides aequoreus TaxID=397278 RepID=UPI0004C31609|nr:hypothetical protein [Nocardioides aequoreus]